MMAGWAEIMVRDRRRLILLAMVVIVLLAGLVLSVDRVMYARALAQEKAVARDDAAILAAGLRSELDKISLLPITLAGDLQVRELLDGDSSHTRLLDTRLENLARQSGAAAIYVMDKDGLTLAASQVEAIRLALASSGVHVSNATVQREVASRILAFLWLVLLR